MSRHRFATIAVLVLVIAINLGSFLLLEDQFEVEVLLRPLPDPTTQDLGDAASRLNALTRFTYLQSGRAGSIDANIAFLSSRYLLLEMVRRDPEVQAFADSLQQHYLDPQQQGSDESRAWSLYKWSDSHIRVSHDVQTGLITLKVRGRYPQHVTWFARSLVGAANSVLSERAARDYQEQGDAIFRKVAEVQETEVQSYLIEAASRYLVRSAMASTSSAFGFEVVDPPSVPFEESWPNHVAILLVSLILATAVLLWIYIADHLSTA